MGSLSRLIVELAVATHTPPSAWWDEDERTIYTAVEVLSEQSRADARGDRAPGAGSPYDGMRLSG